MLKKALLLFSLVLFTGCVERGFELTVNKATHTITAVKSVDIRKEKQTNTAKDIEKMNKAVSKAQHNQTESKTTEKTSTEKINSDITETKEIYSEKTKESQQEIEKQKKIAQESEAEEKRLQIEKERAALEAKLAQEKEAQKIAAERERVLLAQKAEAEKRAQEKKEQALIELKEEKERNTLAEKLAMEKAAREKKEEEDKLALERKIAKAKALQQQKEQEARNALTKKLATAKQTIQNKQEEKNATQAQRIDALRKKDIARKLHLENALVAQKAKEKKVQTTEILNFEPSTQTYQKFGTSEIHGHVVYLTPTGQEISLQNTKVYLVPKNTKTDYWYNNYYLKNREASSPSKTTVHYLNATHLNLEKNFAFYGLATGTYYIIIESDYPSSVKKNQRVYIAKKIDVQKYKKIMTVFSKRL